MPQRCSFCGKTEKQHRGKPCVDPRLLKAPKPRELKLSEADLERYGTELLQHDDWRSLKTDPVKNYQWGKGFGEVGMADHLYLRYAQFLPPVDEVSRSFGQILWIEWKRRKGKPKPHQIEWIEIERERGALVWLADKDFVATPEGFFSHYKASGLMKKRITPSFELI